MTTRAGSSAVREHAAHQRNPYGVCTGIVFAQMKLYSIHRRRDHILFDPLANERLECIEDELFDLLRMSFARAFETGGENEVAEFRFHADACQVFTES